MTRLVTVHEIYGSSRDTLANTNQLDCVDCRLSKNTVPGCWNIFGVIKEFNIKRILHVFMSNAMNIA